MSTKKVIINQQYEEYWNLNIVILWANNSIKYLE